MGSPASTQRKRFQTSDRIKPETCSCKSPGWRTRPGTDPLIYQQLLAPTSAPPQLNHQRSRRLASYHLLFCTLCFKNTVSPGVHTLSAPPPFTHKHLPVLSHPPSPPICQSSCHQVSGAVLALESQACFTQTDLSTFHNRVRIGTKEKANVSGMYSHRRSETGIKGIQFSSHRLCCLFPTWFI